jgi:hypothetical protein
MTISKLLCVAGLVASVSGSAMGQAVNGKLKPEYGAGQWFNTTPTGFGNAGIATAPACDPIGAGVKITLNNSSRAGVAAGTSVADMTAAAAVTTGYEIKVPLATLGMNVASLPDPVVVRVAGWVGSSDYSGVSNQFIGGLGGITGASTTTYPNPNTYPNPRTLDLDQVPGNQYVTISIPKATLLAMVNGNEPTLDGTADASYGAPLAVQDTQTNYGDAATAQGGTDTIFRCGGGSEIDAVYGRYGRDAAGTLAVYLVLAGNFESNFNKVSLFFDSIDGGQNQLTRTSATQTGTFGSIFGGGANAYTANTTTPGLKFDAAFTADFFLGFSVGGSGDASPSIFADWQRISPSATDNGSARFIGGTNATTNGGILTASDPCPPFVPPNYADVANGSEIDSVYAMVCGQYLYVLVTGNIENNGNRLDLFFDVGNVSVPQPSAGQNQLAGNEHPFDFGHLNRLGTDPNNAATAPGLKFSAGFAADYWLSIETTNNPVNLNAYAGLINSNGALNDGGFPTPSYLEYGSIAGGPKASNNPLIFDGQKCIRFDMNNACAPNGAGSAFNPTSIPGLDIQGDSTANGLPLIAEPYSSFAPRLISADVFNPLGVNDSANGHPAPAHGDLTVSGLISVSLDNSNFGGVDGGTDATRARQVTTGAEVKIRLDELGYSGSGPIKLAGFIVSQDHSFLSNQVIGGALASGTANIGEPRTADFTTIAGTGPFFITIDPGTCTTVATGACCFDASTCSLMSSAQCTWAGGNYSGNGSACSPSPCGASGVCCRGATCNTTIASASCTGNTVAGAVFVSSAAACNAGTNTTTPCCYADYNKMAGISVQDIFDFLNDWFAGSKFAVIGGDGNTGTLNVQNIFDFLNAWFAGGC